MLLDKFLPQTDFTSYEDFYQNFKINIPENFNFAWDVVDVIAEQEPEKTAMIWCDDHELEARRFTFADLSRLSKQAANFFLARGIKKGDSVMLILRGRFEFWYTFLALHRIGAVAIPATHMLTTHDIVYRIERADIKMICTINNKDLQDFVDQSNSETGRRVTCCGIDTTREGWIDLTEAVSTAPQQLQRPAGSGATRNSDISILYFTSGTTGFPKMVAHDFTYPLGHILTAKYWQNVKNNGLHYTVADTGWAKAVWGKIYGQWLAGSGVFVYDYEQFDAFRMIHKAMENNVTTFCAPPTIYRFLIKQDLSRFDFSSLKYCVTAGEPLNAEVYEQFKKKTGFKLMEGYGQTELVITAATYPWMEPKPGSMGKPSPSYKLVLLNHEGKPCETGEEGELAIDLQDGKPYGMFLGYHLDEELTDSCWHDGYYFTGDMAWQDEDGYLWFVGRADDVIKSSGYRIGPFEVESALIAHPAVLECAITGVPDPDRGQVVKATVVLTDGYQGTEKLVHELQAHVKKETAPYKYPRIIEFVAELPKTISGKIRRIEIRNNKQK